MSVRWVAVVKCVMTREGVCNDMRRTKNGADKEHLQNGVDEFLKVQKGVDVEVEFVAPLHAVHGADDGLGEEHEAVPGEHLAR